ncbi:uncharacterized protein LOC17878011 isoform X2 [Capsella rubella]|uniref:uncharacterized protein LOC17878011 isoform X2 n=1 Tax=Capsella rubella TaxID=81985 RepID=UPI000CD58F2D|nr:uncharacterized protein LOC17878011 isoform X2 [Capsella rubella]
MNMKLDSVKMILILLGYIVYFGNMVNVNNHFVDAERVENFSDFEKPQAKIIKTTHGDTYECVDFYKQPAFDHPSMKKHLFNYKLRRASSSKRTSNENFGFLWENGIGCPNGTVPINIVTKDEFLRLSSFSKPRGSWNSSNNQINVGNDQHHFAVSRTKERKRKRYTGATMVVSINDPKVKYGQTSSSRMHVQFGDDFIQIGWIVNPKLYHDSKTRSFVYTKAGPPCVRGSKTGSYDTFGLLKDKINGNWWLEFKGVEIGFWPAIRFQHSYAIKIEWGGEVYSAFMPSPQMGNGHFPDKHPAFDAIIFNITTFDENYIIDKWVNNTEIFRDNYHGYNVINGRYGVYSYFPSKHIIYFGGPGNI